MEKEIKIDYVAKESKEYQGVWSRGVKVGDVWYNVRADSKEKVDALFNKDMIHKGNKIKVEIDDYDKTTITKFLDLIEKGRATEDDILNLDKLLNDAHTKGLTSIITELIEHDKEKKCAVFKAVVIMDNKEFHAHGDATQENTTEHIKPHYIRMAETRAICRALRWATNNAEVSKEEI